MRLLRSLPVVLVLAVVLTGCVSTNDLEPEKLPSPLQSTTPIEPRGEFASCADEVEVDTPLVNSLQGMPGIDEVVESASRAKRYERSERACVPAGTQPGYPAEPCAAAIGDNAAYTAPLDYMFAAGAADQTSLQLSAQTAAGAEFAYAASMWRFASASEAAVAPLIDLVSSCDGVMESTSDDAHRFDLFDGDEPHLRLVVAETDVLLYRSVQVADGSGSDGVPSTASGLLSAAAVDHLEKWWLANATKVPREP